MGSIPDAFWIIIGIGVAFYCAFAGLAMVLRNTAERTEITYKETEE